MKFYFGELRVFLFEYECLSRILHKNRFQSKGSGLNSGAAEDILRHVDWSIVSDVSK
jgi:hypothetical protein